MKYIFVHNNHEQILLEREIIHQSAFDRPQALGTSIWVAFSQFILMNTCKGFRNILSRFIKIRIHFVSVAKIRRLFSNICISAFLSPELGGWISSVFTFSLLLYFNTPLKRCKSFKITWDKNVFGQFWQDMWIKTSHSYWGAGHKIAKRLVETCPINV